MVGPVHSSLAPSTKAREIDRSAHPEASEAPRRPFASTAPRASDPVAIATGVLSVLLGLIFLSLASVLRGALSTHFSLTLMGCSFVAMGLNWPLLARLLAVPTGLMNLATFLGYVRFGPPGLDTIIILKIWPDAPKSYSGDLNADLGYALTAIAILLLTAPDWKVRWRWTAIVLAGSAVVGLGLLGFAGYLTGLRTAYGLRRLIQSSADSIIGVLLLGTGLLAVSWRKGRHVSAERHAWILVVVAMTGLVVSTSLWQALMLIQKLPIETTQQFRSYLARIVLTFGLLATALLGVAISLVQKLRSLNEELEHRVQQQTAELQATNKELEAFTYSVSHDLRAPLRHLSGFSKLLLEGGGAGLNETDRRHYLEEIRRAAGRMGLLVDGLLSLSRIGHQDLHPKAVDLNCLVEEVIEELASENQHRDIEWKVANLLPAEGDPILLKEVFANLLANAVKFTRPRRCAVIEVGEIIVNGRTAIFVRDNGVGFNMRYADKLFGIFQRLHRSEDFDGTGIGLAVVQRIVHRHGGQVWAEAEMDRGATFYFTLGSVEP